MKPLVSLVVGTRPDAIKMAPLILELNQQDTLSVRVVDTGQHPDLVTPILRQFGIEAHRRLGVMRPQQPLEQLLARSLEGLSLEFEEFRPRWVLGHGDTTSCFAAALAAFYQQVPFGHVEAGLRSHNLRSPFPEEFHRRAIARHSSLHFAPSREAVHNLVEEGVAPDSISLTGNTIGDALASVLAQPQEIEGGDVLVTWHRREGEGFLRSLHRTAREFPSTQFIIPVHPSPRVKAQVEAELGTMENVARVPPLGYSDFITLLSKARVVITDSGGVQEEASMLGKPLILARDSTERPVGPLTQVLGRKANGLSGALEQALRLAPDPVRLRQGASLRIRQALMERLPQ